MFTNSNTQLVNSKTIAFSIMGLELEDNVQKQLIQMVKGFEAFLIVLDKSIDAW